MTEPTPKLPIDQEAPWALFGDERAEGLLAREEKRPLSLFEYIRVLAMSDREIQGKLVIHQRLNGRERLEEAIGQGVRSLYRAAVKLASRRR